MARVSDLLEKKEKEVEQLPAIADGHYSLHSFDERTIDFLNTLSKKILSSPPIGRLPEMVALAFWIRKANIEKLREENKPLLENKLYRTRPVGRVLHICPANVDTMFVYSLAVSLLMGNKNVLRISSRMEAPQIEELFTIIAGLMQEEKFILFNSYVTIISYGHSDEVSNYLSLHCEARVLWGGDATIEKFKSFKTSPRVRDLAFADRTSLLCINSHSVLSLHEEGWQQFIKLFYNDIYTFDQLGCSSPQAICFLGNEKDTKEAETLILHKMNDYVETHYKQDMPSLASLKLNAEIDDAIAKVTTSLEGNNLLAFAALDTEHTSRFLHSCGGGYLYTIRANKVNELARFMTHKIQTVTHFGLAETEMKDLVTLSQQGGIDRIVPLGTALEFHYIWDGFNLFEQLSRKVFVS